MTADIVVSAENSPHHEWQAQVFHFSCQQHQGQAPIIVVHCRSEEEPLLPGFAGLNVQRVMDCGIIRGRHYCPRNFIGALERAEVSAETIVLMDPDVVFLRPVEFLATRGAVGLDRVGYMDPSAACYADWLPAACASAGVDFGDLLAEGQSGGIPYVIHRDDRAALTQMWFECLEACVEPSTGETPWLGLMWALPIAALKLRLGIAPSDLTILNWAENKLPADKPLIHYCLGDRLFDKRRYEGLMWQARAPHDGTVSDRVLQEIVEARHFYGIC
jgi:hypothetical protein